MKIPLAVILTIIIIGMVACTTKPPPVETQTPNGVTAYNVTAAPTSFAKSTQTIPTVKLNWAYADSQALKIDITVTGLDANANVEDFICDPYLVTKESIQHTSPGREEVKHLMDQPGHPWEITYGYSLNPPIQYKSIDIVMDVTLGPCANSLNYPESNVTPTIVPLIGNYRFTFQVPVQ